MLRLLSPKAQGCIGFEKTIQTLSCWYSLDSYRRALSDEYPFAKVSVILLGVLYHFVSLATSSIRFNHIPVAEVGMHFNLLILTPVTFGWPVLDFIVSL